MSGDDIRGREVSKMVKAWEAELAQIEQQIIGLNARHAMLFQRVQAGHELIETLPVQVWP